MQVTVNTMDADERDVLDRLRDRSVHDNDRVSCIDILEVYLCEEALSLLLAICQDETESKGLRDRAAKAIRVIKGEEAWNK